MKKQLVKVSHTTRHDRLVLVYSKKGKMVVSAYHEPGEEYRRIFARRAQLAAKLSKGKKGLSPLNIPWQAYYTKLLTQGRPLNLRRKDNRKVTSVFSSDELRKIEAFLRKI